MIVYYIVPNNTVLRRNRENSTIQIRGQWCSIFLIVLEKIDT